MQTWLKERRRRLEVDLTSRGLGHTFSLARFALHQQVAAQIRQYAHGDALDLGAGLSPYRALLEHQCTKISAFDAVRRADTVDFIGDVQSMREIESSVFDTVLCTQVLEHVPRPWKAMEEIARILRPGGTLIASAPHLSALHEVPNDFYRYTEYGLASLIEGAGLRVINTVPAAGLIAFSAHGLSYVVLTLASLLPGVRWVVWLLNYLVLVRFAGWVDRLVGFRSVYPCNVVLVGSKTNSTKE